MPKDRWSKAYPSLRVHHRLSGQYEVERVCGATYTVTDTRQHPDDLEPLDGSGPWRVDGWNNLTDVNFPTKGDAMLALEGIGRHIKTERA